MINEIELRKAIAIMKPNNQLFEVRLICGDKSNYSGYFTEADSLINSFKNLRINGNSNAYITLNSINEACYGRVQHNAFVKNPKATTSDNDVVGYDWLLIDLDPRRPTDTSSSDEQIAKAKEKGNEIFSFMRNLGFSTPLFGFSGNGVHLLYRVYLKNSDENKKLIEKCLKTLSLLFTDDVIDVDMKNFNPARVCKLYGTVAQKGASIQNRPHRCSQIIGNPEEIQVNDRQYLEKLCDLYPKEEKPQKYNNYKPTDFNLEEWLDRYNLRYKKNVQADITKYALECCPFDSNHTGKDACVFQSKGGAIGFHCFHNSCTGKTWKDVRMMFEPEAYEKRQQEYEQRIYQRGHTNDKPRKIEVVEGQPVFYTAKDILNLPKADEIFIKTGITDIDRHLRGLKKGFVSVISGLRSCGKSSVISQITLNVIDDGNNVGIYSGELSPRNFMRWMNLQAAGKGFVEPSQFEGYYNVPRRYQENIANWLDNKMYLYNNDYGNDYVAIIEQFEKEITEKNLDLLILDNLMAFNISGLSENKYDAQTEFVMSLKRLAVRTNTHIIFVAHPRKTMQFLRLEDISGTGDLANAVDNAFIVHRVNQDFRTRTKEMFGWKPEDSIYQATNVIETAKDRDGGTQDHFTPLHYEKETKRLKNSISENRIYGWNRDNGEFTSVTKSEIDQMEIPFS